MNRFVDEYGIPDNMLGSIPEPYFALLGRIVAVAGLLEIQIAHLHASLGTAPQDKSFGLDSGRALRDIFTALNVEGPVLARPTMDDEARRETRLLTENLRDAMYRRNEFLHGPWTESHGGQIYSWRALPTSQKKKAVGETSTSPTAGEYVDEADLQEFLRHLVALVDEVKWFLPSLERFPRWS
jgi:hypothetical protein